MALGGVLGDGAIERLDVNRAPNDRNDQNGALKAAKRPKTDQKYPRATAHLEHTVLYHLRQVKSESTGSDWPERSVASELQAYKH